MTTNKAQLKYLENEIRRVGNLIEAQGAEPELKALATRVRAGEVVLESVIPEVMELDPHRNERLCEYYIALFSEFERLKRAEHSAKERGMDAHHAWLNSAYQRDNETAALAKLISRNIAEKIAVSGVTAGLIWLGKAIIEHWPFGYSYSASTIHDEDGTV